MTGTAMGLAVFAGLLGMLVLRVHVGVAMFIAGCVAYLLVNHGDTRALFYTFNDLVYARLSNYDLAVVPLFILMGQFATHGGLSKMLFRAAASLIGHWPGGLAMATIGACASFGAICGSSLATAATMGQVAVPELRRIGYSGRLSTGSVAAGGTLGILIPPSVPLVIYAMLTQESIGKLFVAAVVPGLIAVAGYLTVIFVLVTIDPTAGPAAPKANARERASAIVAATPVSLIFLVVIVGIYDGWANPTEAASIGAAACGLFAWLNGMRRQGLLASLLGTAEGSAMIFLVLIGADIMNSGLALTQLPGELAAWVKGSNLPPLAVLFAILAIYVLLGFAMDSLAMILLTVPIFYPIVTGLDIGGLTIADKSIWFGILLLMVVEIGLVHPPLGMNLFIVNKFAREVSYSETAWGVVPFLVADFARVLLLVFLPILSLWHLR